MSRRRDPVYYQYPMLIVLYIGHDTGVLIFLPPIFLLIYGFRHWEVEHHHFGGTWWSLTRVYRNHYTASWTVTLFVGGKRGKQGSSSDPAIALLFEPSLLYCCMVSAKTQRQVNWLACWQVVKIGDLPGWGSVVERCAEQVWRIYKTRKFYVPLGVFLLPTFYYVV